MTSPVRFLSVCSGIEAASVAWQPLGWKAWAFSEIEPFPSSQRDVVHVVCHRIEFNLHAGVD